ncbi:MAG TPA: protein kinase [Pseudonocardiaceae bacterium]|nr:protein kinase [Pseudonocardiaceae bacterium]
MVARFAPLAADDPHTIAGYTLRARIGVGGMGRVYLAFSPGGRPLAIKVVRPEFAQDEEFRRRFQQEVAAAQRVQGMFTAQVVDADTRGPLPWLATAYVPGPSLAQAVAEHGPLPPPTVFRLMAGVAEGLAAVHACGLIHRDLKPANVLLAADGPRVIDFGIAHAAGATAITRTGMRVGTPAFMAPEQIRDGAATPAVDVFALGNLALFAAIGRTAFGNGNTEALFHRILNEQPDLGGCPPALCAILERCLAKEPGGRPTLGDIMTYARAHTRGDTLSAARSWLPESIVTSFAGYDTGAFPPPPRPPTIVLSPKKANKSSTGAGVAALLIAVLALIYWVPKMGNPGNNSSSGFAPTTQPPVYTTSEPDPTSDPTTSDPPTIPTTLTFDPPAIPTTPPFDPNSLNDVSTDPTPQTPDALLANGFTDGTGRQFTRTAGWNQPCITNNQTNQVQQILANADCNSATVGDYVSDDSSIMVSIKVMGLPNRATAVTTFNELVNTSTGDAGIVCPPYPRFGSHICDSGNAAAFRAAAKWGRTGQQYRYVLLAVAMYRNLSQYSSPALTAASTQAVDSSGPQN